MEINDLRTSQSNPEEDIKTYLYLILRNWYWLILGLVLGLGFAWFYLRYAVDVYEVKGSVFIDYEGKNQISQEAILADYGLGSKSQGGIENELQILKSSTLMTEVVDSLALGIRIFREGRLKDTELYGKYPFYINPILLNSKNVSLSIRIKISDSENFQLIGNAGDSTKYEFGERILIDNFGYISIDIPTDHTPSSGAYRISIKDNTSAARQYASKVRLRPIGGSDVVELSMNDGTPERAIDILNELINVYNVNTIKNKNLSGEKTLAFIQERLSYITKELYDVEREVEGFKRTNDIPVDPGLSASNYLSEIKDVDKELAQLDLSFQLLKDTRSKLLNDKAEKLPFAGEILGSTLSSIIPEYNKAIFERDNFLEAATSDNPAVVTYEEKLKDLKESILLNIDNLERELRLKKAALEESAQPLQQKIAQIPRIERQLLQIMRQQQIKEQLFLILLQKREETALRIAAQTSNAKILEQPRLSSHISPKRGQIYLFAAGLGLLLPLLLVFLAFFFDNKVHSKDYIQKLSTIPFLGMIAQGDEKEKIVVSKGNRSAIAEMFRLLRTNIKFLNPQEGSQVILVTSSISGEGKTFISVNLASSLAQSGKKTIVVGLDLRKPKLSLYLKGEKDKSGITNLLISDKGSLSSLIQPIEGIDDLDYIDCGPVPPNPSELLMTERLNNIFRQLKETYDYIIIDSAPVGLVTDTMLIGKYADQTLVICRYNYTSKELIKMQEENYQKEKLPRMGIVLNGIKKGGAYGYGYGYGYGYYSDDVQKKWWQFWKKS